MVGTCWRTLSVLGKHKGDLGMSEQQPGYAQQAPPQGYNQPGPPPKKKHTVRNIFFVLIGLFILMVGGCVALLGGAANEIDQAIQEEEANDKPRAVREGGAFTHDDFSAEAGWKVAKERFGGAANIKGLRVTNEADEARSALLTFRFYKGNEVLTEVECTSNQVQPGEASRLNCVSFDTRFPKGYDTIKVSDAF
jgi:hypothetical protein